MLMRFSFLWILFGPLVASASQNKTLHVVTMPIPMMVENSERGAFISLTREIAKRNHLKIDIAVVPPGRSILAFTNGQADIMFPALESFLPKKYHRSIHFYEKIDYVFYRKKHKLETIHDLEGKKVGLIFRYHYAKELTENKKIQFEFASDEFANMKKLQEGRVDALVLEEQSGMQALQASKMNDIEYNKERPVSKQLVFYAFQSSAEGHSLAHIFSKTIQAMKSDGSFDAIISNHQPKISD